MRNTNGTKLNVRFLDVDKEPRSMIRNRQIEGYQNISLMTLQQAIQPIEHLYPDLASKVFIANENFESCQDSDRLTKNEASAIYLYASEWGTLKGSFHDGLNSALRSDDRHLLTPWYEYLKLLLTALNKLPSLKQKVWRGFKGNLSKRYQIGKQYTWLGISSCTECVDLFDSNEYLGQSETRTIFSIECINGKSIKSHSYYQAQNEIVLLPATCIEVIDYDASFDKFCMIFVREIESLYDFSLCTSTDDVIPIFSEQNVSNISLQSAFSTEYSSYQPPPPFLENLYPELNDDIMQESITTGKHFYFSKLFALQQIN
ncbi:unnamed protein product [Didymodactylos carnosus]|uniref:NAD(P)(+)--arginine ADP-ribosyltransferase n=1 Tax=Didymodactylos carnosus TaxID=1234261 RepID=A0A8S2DTP4_9BILA|nr:unnamed protein product [Didymodactylos carnosus]CAF3749430.1 unnamed protein product [Didymodactylos carnosus]